MDYTRKVSQGHLLTSSGESADSWASRETSVSLDFLDRLMLRVTGTFLTEALVTFGDFTVGSVSCTRGSLATTSSVGGADGASLFGSSSSLKAKGKKVFTTRKEQSKHNEIIELEENLRCHDQKVHHLLLEQGLHQP
jgi:hypothetical protein